MNSQNAESRSAPIGEDEIGHYRDLPVGEILRRARLHYGQSVEDAGAVLRIRASQLDAIEQGRIDLLPGRVYAIGFVRAYAEYLGLDGEKIVHLFKLQLGGQGPRTELYMPSPASDSKAPGPYIVGGSLVVLVVMMAGLGFWVSRAKPAESLAIPEAPQSAAIGPETIGPYAAGGFLTGEKISGGEKALQEEVAEPVPRLVITLKSSAWIEIRDGKGKAVLSKILKEGDSYIVPAKETVYVLDTGNVGALEFSVDGAALAPLGAEGDIRRGIRLNPDELKEADKKNPRKASDKKARTIE